MTQLAYKHRQNHQRCIALYPGAFRPPHAVHLRAVRHLLSQPDVDEVVIIISNRCRIIPGTTLALDARTALVIWSMYLRDIKHVRAEIAPHTAVRHALGYFDHMAPGDTLLFCMGEADCQQGDKRFEHLDSFASDTSVHARTIAAPTGSSAIRSTGLREALAAGEMGRDTFLSALPAEFSHSQRARVWQICRSGLQEMSQLIREKIRVLISKNQLGEIESIRNASEGKVDQVFRVQLRGGRTYFVKYAGDTVTTGVLGNPMCYKPRKRLSTERRTLKRLRQHRLDTVVLPEVVLFDKPTWSLVLSEVCPGGHSLQKALEVGRFDQSVAQSLSCFLAACHTVSAQVEPVWGDEKTDQQHWQRMLALRTVDLCSHRLPSTVCRNLETLASRSRNASMRRLFILDVNPVNVLIHQDEVGVTDLELTSVYGDPAYDIGIFLGHYFLWGLVTNSRQPCGSALQAAVLAYRKQAADLWPKISARVVAFVGAGMLYSFSANRNKLSVCEDTLISHACRLISTGLDQVTGAEQWLFDTMDRM